MIVTVSTAALVTNVALTSLLVSVSARRKVILSSAPVSSARDAVIDALV